MLAGSDQLAVGGKGDVPDSRTVTAQHADEFFAGQYPTGAVCYHQPRLLPACHRGENLTVITPSSCAVNSCSSLPDAASQRRAALSAPPVRKLLPSGATRHIEHPAPVGFQPLQDFASPGIPYNRQPIQPRRGNPRVVRRKKNSAVNWPCVSLEAAYLLTRLCIP